jgi:hypothetical protein
MTINLKDNAERNFYIAILCVVASTGLSVYIFSASRLDPGLRMAALVSATNLSSALVAIASTLLVGKVFGPDKGTPSLPDLPPGASSAQVETTGETTTATVTKS